MAMHARLGWLFNDCIIMFISNFLEVESAGEITIITEVKLNGCECMVQSSPEYNIYSKAVTTISRLTLHA